MIVLKQPQRNSNESFGIASGTQQTNLDKRDRITVGDETVSLLGAVLDQAIAALPPDGRSQERKTLLASKLLSAASAGERDPVRLREAALATGPYGTQ
jgi:hypothetical protein